MRIGSTGSFGTALGAAFGFETAPPLGFATCLAGGFVPVVVAGAAADLVAGLFADWPTPVPDGRGVDGGFGLPNAGLRGSARSADAGRAGFPRAAGRGFGTSRCRDAPRSGAPLRPASHLISWTRGGAAIVIAWRRRRRLS